MDYNRDEKIIKEETAKILETYKQYKNIFERIKKISKKLYYQNKLQNCENNIKTTWKIIEEMIGKSKVFPKFCK